VPIRDGHSTTGEGHTGLPHASHEKKEGNGLKTRQTTCSTNMAEFLSLDLGEVCPLRIEISSIPTTFGAGLPARRTRSRIYCASMSLVVFQI